MIDRKLPINRKTEGKLHKTGHMENLARAFDQPIDSQEHHDLATTAWLGGDLVTVRYWLGRLLRRNLFRESDDVVKHSLQKYLLKIGCK